MGGGGSLDIIWWEGGWNSPGLDNNRSFGLLVDKVLCVANVKVI